MINQNYRKRKRLVGRIYAVVLVFIAIMGIRITWHTVSSANDLDQRLPEAFEPMQPAIDPFDPVREPKFRIVIDAGHGGKDPGATGASGNYEKEYNLSLALQVVQLLEQDPIFEIKMTRMDDRFIELEDRAEIANAWNADALVSIHGNTFEDPAVSGTETLYFNDISLPLALELQQHVSDALELRDRGVKQEEFVVLTTTNMPAVIVETGYLTNPAEESKLLSIEGQQLAAQALYEGLKAYFDQQTPRNDYFETFGEAPPDFPSVNQSNAHNKIFFNGSSIDGKQVALTFDDGPDLIATPKILDVLKKNNIKATFFLLGNRVQANPDMAKRIAEEGHAVGNHSWNHPNFNEISTEEALEEIERTQSLLEDTIGYRPALFRPPYGALKQDKLDRITGINLTVVNWSVDTMDWSGITSSEIMDLVREQIYPGGIVLQHSANGTNGLDHTIEALEQMIPELAAEGYTFVTVPELLKVPEFQELF